MFRAEQCHSLLGPIAFTVNMEPRMDNILPLYRSCRLNMCMITYTKPDQTWKSLKKAARFGTYVPKRTENDPLSLLHVDVPTCPSSPYPSGRHCFLLIEAYSQYTKHHSDLLTLKSLNFLPYDFGRIWAYIF